jgi:hypothetical protein
MAPTRNCTCNPQVARGNRWLTASGTSRLSPEEMHGPNQLCICNLQVVARVNRWPIRHCTCDLQVAGKTKWSTAPANSRLQVKSVSQLHLRAPGCPGNHLATATASSRLPGKSLRHCNCDLQVARKNSWPTATATSRLSSAWIYSNSN